MSRYTGPRVKICRALGVDLPGLTRRTIERRPFPPGQHGQARKKVTEYGLRLKEKQKIRLYYGVTERQLRRVMSEAIRSKTASGDKLVELLERRLDNAVFRAGFARTIPHARQLVAHGHVRVNGRRVDIPSFRVSAGDELSLTESARKNQGVQAAIANIDSLARAQWLTTDTTALTAKIVTLPDVSAPLFPLNLQLVVEFYSLRLLQKPCGSGGARARGPAQRIVLTSAMRDHREAGQPVCPAASLAHVASNGVVSICTAPVVISLCTGQRATAS